ncbi:hypothetical protein M0802_007544 [Mischocyttarus mexicanus]|nr:hypothetical protein M0802_007544 [Mischocyttarus mexicanus]
MKSFVLISPELPAFGPEAPKMELCWLEIVRVTLQMGQTILTWSGCCIYAILEHTCFRHWQTFLLVVVIVIVVVVVVVVVVV